MTKAHVITKASLIAVGIYVVSFILGGFHRFVRYLVIGLNTELWHRVLNYSLILTFGLLAYQLFVKADKWALRIIDKGTVKTKDNIAEFAFATYRITVFFCGVFLVFFAIPTIEQYIRSHLEPKRGYGHGLTVYALIRWVLGFYLICGGSAFVHWQVHKTLNYINMHMNSIRSNSVEKICGKDITMNKMQMFAKIALAIMGLFVIIEITKSILNSLPLIGAADSLYVTIMSCISIIGLVVLIIVVIHQLFIRGDKWASKIVCYPEKNQSRISPDWLPTTFRLVSVIAGILFLYWTLPSFFSLISSSVIGLSPELKAKFYPGSAVSYFYPRFVSFALRLALTVYFLCGAPQFTRWHVRKALEYYEPPTTKT